MGDWKGIRLNAANNSKAPIKLYNLKNNLSEKITLLFNALK